MLAEGDVTIMLTPMDKNAFSKVDVYELDGTTEVSIVVHPKEMGHYFNVGTINVLVKNPDGSEQLMEADRTRIDKHRFGTKLQHAHFHFSIPYVLPSGTVLVISSVAHE